MRRVVSQKFVCFVARAEDLHPIDQLSTILRKSVISVNFDVVVLVNRTLRNILWNDAFSTILRKLQLSISNMAEL